MARLRKGDVVWFSFPRVVPPGADAKTEDMRPALVLQSSGVNVVVGMLTTKDYTSQGAVKLAAGDYVAGGSDEISYFRPDRIWTDHEDWADSWVGRLHAERLTLCYDAIDRFLRS